MDTASAFAKGFASRGRELMVFDWAKAAELIRERKPLVASAGLAGDWEWTGGSIYRNGAPVPREETYTYLASTWATPQLDIDGEIIACFRMASEVDGWGESTYWPDEAVAALTKHEAL